MPLSRFARVYRRAVGDSSMTLILALLVVYTFAIAPLGEMGLVERQGLNLAFLGVLGVSSLAFVRRSALARLFIGALVGLAVTHGAASLAPRTEVLIADALCGVIASGLLATLLLRRTLRRGEINIHRYQGAIATYLLLGCMFARAFELVARIEPDAFHILGAPAGYDVLLPRLLYFSFTTLTTLGYGDITPVHTYARSLAVLESLVGVIYPAVLIARLVSLDVIEVDEARRRGRRDQSPRPRRRSGPPGGKRSCSRGARPCSNASTR